MVFEAATPPTASGIMLVDIGNTSIKYCALEDVSGVPTVIHSLGALLDILFSGESVTCVYIANVGKQTWNSDIISVCEQRGIQCHVIGSEKSRFGITNSYAEPSRMGVDRWLAILAGAALTEKDYAVIDIGTAMTCDFVVNKCHVGGWIAPGFTTMRNALIANTQLVFADDSFPDAINAGTDTQQCVAQGCHAAVLGFGLAAKAFLQGRSEDFEIIIGGGGKKMLTSVELGASIHAANLVVQGLARYASLDVTSVFSK